MLSEITPNYNNQQQLWLASTKALRKTIGILGLALPFLLYFFQFLYNGKAILAIFLVIYKGHDKTDFFVSTLAAIGALLVAFFPTSNIAGTCTLCADSCVTCATNANPASVTILPDSAFRETLHYIGAAIFLGSLACMSIFLFTKSNKDVAHMTPEKKLRNKIYITCGIIMIACIVAIFLLGFLELIPAEVYAANQLTFWLETVAVESFGLSWLIKGEALFGDKHVMAKL
jgi:hypothetical protein